jgi:hypothetical protein
MNALQNEKDPSGPCGALLMHIGRCSKVNRSKNASGSTFVDGIIHRATVNGLDALVVTVA